MTETILQVSCGAILALLALIATAGARAICRGLFQACDQIDNLVDNGEDWP